MGLIQQEKNFKKVDLFRVFEIACSDKPSLGSDEWGSVLLEITCSDEPSLGSEEWGSVLLDIACSDEPGLGSEERGSVSLEITCSELIVLDRLQTILGLGVTSGVSEI